MFDKLDKLPRREDGTLRNEWVEGAFHTLILALVRLQTAGIAASVQAQMHALWQSWWQPADGIGKWLHGEQEAQQARWAESVFADAKPEDAGKPQILLDLEAGLRLIREARDDAPE